MSKKSIRAQRHQSQAKQSIRSGRKERSNEMSESIEKTKKGLKKSVVFSGKKYVIDLLQE